MYVLTRRRTEKMKHLGFGNPIEMRLHYTNGTGICEYCGATSEQIKSGKAGACEDYERRNKS